MHRLPGLEMSSGSLGMGLSVGVGMAWAARYVQQDWRTWVLCGDGELDEGQNWEAFLLAAKLGLTNLVAVIDRNRVQLDGPTEQILPLGDLTTKIAAFGWQVRDCDGHSVAALAEACQWAEQARDAPRAIVAHTVKGKGVSFMEGDHAWHGKPLSEADYRQAALELEGRCERD